MSLKNNINLSYLYYSYKKYSDTANTIILIHGISGSSSAWEKYVDFFYKNKFNVLIFDIRGHGKSLKSNKKKYYRIENLADDLNELIKIENIKNPIIITHSFATFIILEFIKKFPNIKINKLILISPLYDLGLNKISLILINLGSNIILVFRKIGIQINYNKYLRNTKDSSFKRLIIESLNTNLKVITSLFYYVSQKDYKKYFKFVKSPTLLIHGKKDTLSLFKTSIEISKMIKDSKVNLYDDSDHLIIFKDFEIISWDILKYIED